MVNIPEWPSDEPSRHVAAKYRRLFLTQMHLKGPWLLGTRVGPLKPTNSTTLQRLEAYVLLQGGKSKNKQTTTTTTTTMTKTPTTTTATTTTAQQRQQQQQTKSLPHSAVLEVKALR